MRTVAFCEIEPFCRAVLRKHWPDVPIFEDVRTLTAADVPGVDVICGGYPCQPESVAGKRMGASDDRWLWPEYRRIIEEFRPTWVIGENVAGHISMGLDTVLFDLEALGYAWRTFVIPACAVGAQHRRDRTWIIANSECLRELQPQGCKPDQRRRPNNSITQNDANASSKRLQGQSERADSNQPYGAQPWSASRGISAPAIITDSICRERSLSGKIGRVGRRESISWHGLGEITSEPFVRRGTHGIRNRAHRLRALGNAVVPQIPEIIGRAIIEAEKMIT